VAYSRFCKRVIDGVGGGGSGGGLSASLDREFGGLGKSGGGGAEAALGALQKTIDAAAMSAARGRPFHAVFRAYDENGTGLVGREDAQAALRQLHADLNATELQLVVDRLPPRADRRVDYNALYAELLRTTPRGAGLGLGGTAGSVALPAPATPLVDLRGSGGFAPMSVGGLGMMGGGMGGGGGGMAMGAMGGVNDNLLPNISRRVRSTVRQQQGQWGPQFTLARLFEGYDPVGRGTVTSQQFQTVLAQLGLPLAAVEVAQLQRRFDRFGDGTGFDYRDFARFVELDGNELSVVLGNVAAKLAEVRRRGVDVRLAFAMNDIGETGFISGRDFREASRQLTLPMTEAHLQLVTSKYSALGNPNLVSYDEFLRAANGAMPALDLDGGGSVFGSARRDSRGLGTVAGGGYDGFSSGGAYRAREGRGSRDLDDGGFGGGRASARRGFDSAGGRAPRFGDSGARGTPYGGRKSASYDDHESAFGDEARSPVRQLGVKMYGAGTPLRDRGSLPPSGRGFASGHWTCVVCLCSDNVGPECEICNAPNPSSKHAVVTQQCPGCSFQNTDSAVECAMCGERMADIRRGRGGGGGAGGSAKIAAWRDDHDSDGDSYDVRRPSRRD
jgi:Ca2+-binding EF-hand superfamily protein